ncbi:hypothetical protein RD792_015490 [Penstemon davidsonii]|uniref:PWWP domain-containing protein n=1 Tax=Penstemon davidsonii TaxID=160366 RepID=A0ABR0CGZ0_9LAMI|nr:hypothetical protein RD792_015490 [Penstemon davidsonii]
MPKIKRGSVEEEEITGQNDDDVESCSPAVKSKKLKRINNQLFTVPIKLVERGINNFSNYWPATGTSSFNGGSNLVSERVDNNKPPLLKSSRGRAQVLPKKFSDSVMHPWKKEKPGCCDDLGDCSVDSKYVQDVNLKRGESSAPLNDIYLVKKSKSKNQLGFQLKNIILEPHSTSRSSVTSVNEGVSCVSPMLEGDGKMNVYAGMRKPEKEKVVEKKADFYGPSDFLKGDIVWAKCGKNFAAWPAIVIDPLLQAPEAVLRACVPGTLCVMFYGYSRNGQRDYAWIKAGMAFPFHEYMDRFQGQTKLYGSKPSDFHMAIEEAILAENGYTNSTMEAEQETLPVTSSGDAEEATGSNQESEFTIQQASFYWAI